MFVYVGIDEAGYGPRFGPLVVGRATLAVPKLPPWPDADPPRLWQRLSQAVCKSARHANGRLPVADSKKLKTPAAGLRHLERGCLAFAALAGRDTTDLGGWLDALGGDGRRGEGCPPWYALHDGDAWDPLPAAVTPGETAIDRSMLAATCGRIGVTCPGLAAVVLDEPTFNARLRDAHSKAAVSFDLVARHLDHAWRTHGRASPLVVVDRQGGRTAYRDLLSLYLPDVDIAVVRESPEASRYELTRGDRRMHVWFECEAEDRHMPVALASMVSKYTRELMMARLNRYFAAAIDGLKPSAGYGTDGNRFLRDVAPHLPRLGLAMADLRRDA